MEENEYDEFAEGVTPEQPEGSSEQPSEEVPDLTEEVLRLKGIEDPSKIKFQDESGAIVERSWDDLTREEQLNIFADQSDGSENLAEDEIQLLNTIRNSGMSVNDYLQSLQPELQAPSYRIDELSDDDVYVLDVLDKVGSDNISDEELSEALENAKKNEGLFKKTVEGLRQHYIQLQQDEEAQEANQVAQEQQAQYNQFSNAIQQEIMGLNTFAGRPLELSNEDVNDLADFTLNLDASGLSAFGRAMQDPAIFTRAAFWVLNEDAIISELTRQIQENYTRGYNAGKNDKGTKLVIPPKTTQKKAHQGIEDLDYDEFD